MVSRNRTGKNEGYPFSQVESLEEATMVHGIPVDLLVARLNAYLESVGK